MTTKQQIDKTRWDWLCEWALHFLLMAGMAGLNLFLLCCVYLTKAKRLPAVADLAARNHIVLPEWLCVILACLGFLMVPLTVVCVLIWIIRTPFVLGAFFSPPPDKCLGLKQDDRSIYLELAYKEPRKLDRESIRRIVIAYNTRSILFVLTQTKLTFLCDWGPEELEKRLDELEGFQKEVSSFESREGAIRTVFYIHPNVNAGAASGGLR